MATRTITAFIFYNCAQLLFGYIILNEFTNSYIFFDQLGFGLFLLITRMLYFFMSYVFDSAHSKKKIAFIGVNNNAVRLINHFKETNSSTKIAGVFGENNDGGFGIPTLGEINSCIDYAMENQITEIYSTLSPKLYPQLYQLAETAEKSFIRFKFVPDPSEFVGRDCRIDFINNTPIISLRNEPLAGVQEQFIKRLFDIVISGLVSIFILSWLIPILALLIKLDSKGPVFFTQLRSGQNNVPFNVLKLRTLRVNDDADSLQVTRGDSRITQIGRFLRKTNLDELPQFINVLLGNMSIVGSRPHMLKHTIEYSQLFDNYMLRHYTKPGITGWAQVNGYRGEITEPEQLKKRIEYDLWYAENWTIWLDFKIVILTAIKTIKGDENAF